MHALDAARTRFGATVDRILPRLTHSDLLADAALEALEAYDPARTTAWLNAGLRAGPGAIPDAPDALKACLADAWSVPRWVDRAACDEAGRLLFRSGMLGGLVLGTKSLVLGYASPGGNKPLVLSGRLSRPEYAAKRLAETAKFVMAVSEPGGLEPGALGHQITLRVRLMHAKVRRLVLGSGLWRSEDWGHPINQHDMLATILVFSAAFLQGVGQLGVQVSSAEADAYTQLWRRVGHVIGVEQDLLPEDAYQALHWAQLIELTQGPPDDDARALVKSYFDAPLLAAKTVQERQQAKGRVAFGRAVGAYLLGAPLAAQLGLQHPSEAGWLDHLRRAVRGAEHLRGASRRLDDWAVARGRAHWAKVVQLGLAGGAADFALPGELLGRLSGGSAPSSGAVQGIQSLGTSRSR